MTEPKWPEPEYIYRLLEPGIREVFKNDPKAMERELRIAWLIARIREDDPATVEPYDGCWMCWVGLAAIMGIALFAVFLLAVR